MECSQGMAIDLHFREGGFELTNVGDPKIGAEIND